MPSLSFLERSSLKLAELKEDFRILLKRLRPPPYHSPPCLAPWTHAFLHPNGTRRLCCVSGQIGKELEALPDFWNSAPMKRARRRMLAGEWPEACGACASGALKSYEAFEKTFSALRPEIEKRTSWSGATSMAPRSFDYRVSNLCNFKCHMCWSEFSSSIAKETAQLKGESGLPETLREPKHGRIQSFQREKTRAEMMARIEAGEVSEIYWAGGEPLILDFHWEAMERIIELGYANRVNVSYNTNFSSISYRGRHLFRDILSRFSSFYVGASLDATGPTGEYLRAGLRWDRWLANLQEALPYLDQTKRCFSVSLTVTTLGLPDLKNVLALNRDYGTPIDAKLVDGMDLGAETRPWSPLLLPRALLDRLLEETWEEVQSFRNPATEQVFGLLDHLKKCETAGDRMGPSELQSLRGTFRYIKRKEALRGTARFTDFLETKPYLREWFRQFYD